MIREIDPRIIVRSFSVGGSDRVILTGDVDHAESIIKAFATANAFMDDRGMQITVAGNRILGARLGELGGNAGGGGAQAGLLSAIGTVDRYTFFGNQNNNIARSQTMISDGGRVTSLIKVRKVPMIVLHVTFLEMNSSAAREIGAQLGLSFVNQNFSFALGGNNGNAGANGVPFVRAFPGIQGTQNNPFSPGTGFFSIPTGIATATGAPNQFAGPFYSTPNNFGATVLPVNFVNQASGVFQALGLGALNTVPAGLLSSQNLFGIPGGTAFTPNGLANLFTGISNITNGNASRWSINPTLQGVIAHNRARVLAEPTLVTTSGERAAFLAGGEIPIIQSIATAGAAASSIVYEPFGLRLNMIPVLQENGTINLQVSPEERLLAPSIGFNVPGSITIIPGFTTRKTQTTVDMRPGQELFISGLVSANHGREVSKTPIFGEIPVLGTLYKSKSFAKNESELVIAVRPEIILPGTPGQLKLPEEISKVEGPRDTNFLQVEPTVLDEGYYRKGRAEKSLQLPGTLPPDAPIPDTK
jgi:Flp pilus assembly secretin CpaC